MNMLGKQFDFYMCQLDFNVIHDNVLYIAQEVRGYAVEKVNVWVYVKEKTGIQAENALKL